MTNSALIARGLQSGEEYSGQGPTQRRQRLFEKDVYVDGFDTAAVLQEVCHLQEEEEAEKEDQRVTDIPPLHSMQPLSQIPCDSLPSRTPQIIPFAQLAILPPPPPPPPPVKPEPGMSKEDKKKLVKRNKRRIARANAQAASGTNIKRHAQKHIDKARETAILIEHVAPPRGAWSGPKLGNEGSAEMSLDEVLAIDGMRLLEWDGSDSKIIRDSNDIPLVLLGPRIKAQNWSDMVERISSLLEKAREDVHVDPQMLYQRQGNYVSLNAGISLGGGQKRPSNLLPTSEHNGSILEELQSNPDVVQVVGYCDYLFRSYFPKLHQLYKRVLETIIADDPSLKRNFPNSQLAGIRYNFKNAVDVPHRDFSNLFFGQCGIFACGNYNYKKGGHIVLWDLGLVIEFPPGTVVFIPDALLLYSTTKILTTETRSSMMLYSAAALFRWVHNGGMTDRQFRENASDELKKEWNECRKNLNITAMDILRDF
ncbi:hypothetical protein K435DRAFT_960104 [Dendrothele bispora CBS 962.96]|uniref:Uncharacterized protein n=1 Tax=Dendrothele bispora (strain CBS 962.96) TaxID=1314807 RepID=A0A4S8MWR6_DENBC|nr:hypothetical protein K435DRAFT_960104 [Dendrothele bispora CBS 962.96]